MGSTEAPVNANIKDESPVKIENVESLQSSIVLENSAALSEDKDEKVAPQKSATEERTPKEHTSAFKAFRPIVADYSSGSESESPGEESDDSASYNSDESHDLSISDFISVSSSECDVSELIQPVEDLKISVPKEEAKGIGLIKHIVECQVVIEPKILQPALDLGTVLFLDEGQRALGRIDDVFGPVTEPLYVVIFHSDSEIKAKDIKPGMMVYYAPTTCHTSYAPVTELMKMRGSDASWKHNHEAPSECQDFSDDEAETRARGERPTYDEFQRPQKRNWQQRGNQHRSLWPHSAPNNRGESHETPPRQFRTPDHSPTSHYRSPPHPSSQFDSHPGPNFDTSLNFSPQQNLPAFNPSVFPSFSPIIRPPPPPMLPRPMMQSPLMWTMPPPPPPPPPPPVSMAPPPIIHNPPICTMPPPPLMNVIAHNMPPPMNIPPPPVSLMHAPPLFDNRPAPRFPRSPSSFMNQRQT